MKFQFDHPARLSETAKVLREAFLGYWDDDWSHLPEDQRGVFDEDAIGCMALASASHLLNTREGIIDLDEHERALSDALDAYEDEQAKWPRPALPCVFEAMAEALER